MIRLKLEVKFVNNPWEISEIEHCEGNVFWDSKHFINVRGKSVFQS